MSTEWENPAFVALRVSLDGDAAMAVPSVEQFIACSQGNSSSDGSGGSDPALLLTTGTTVGLLASVGATGFHTPEVHKALKYRRSW